MKFSGDISVEATPDAVYAKVRDARFFASCIEGVQSLNEIDADHYTAVLETKVAYLKFKFNVAVEVVRAEAAARDRGQDRRHAARHRRAAHRELGDEARAGQRGNQGEL